MNHLLNALGLMIVLPLFGQAPQENSPDPFAKVWDVDCKPKGCLMFLDIGHGNPEKPEFLTITVAVSKETKSPAFISFIVPAKADQKMGLAIGFANSEKNEKGEWALKLVEGSTRVLAFEGCKDGDCTASVRKGVVPAEADSKELNLIDQFLKHRFVLFYYWVNGERVRVSTTLSGFQAQYPKVLAENLR